MTSFESGRSAEEAAATYLEQQGYVVLNRNWRTRWCEIDIVAKKENCIYFVEVKYRKNNLNGSGLDYITPKKLAQMSRAAESWAQLHIHTNEYQLMAIDVKGSNYEVSSVLQI